MRPRAAISNGIITVVILFFMLLLGMLLKARYRMPTERTGGPPPLAGPLPSLSAGKEVPKAIPVAVPVVEKVHEARAYKQGDWWVLPSPELIESRANEADTLRIRSGPKEDVFVLYFVDAAETSATRLGRVRDQSSFFNHASQERIFETGLEAQAFVADLLKRHPFKVFTKWGRVPETERYYAFVAVETEPGMLQDLGELLMRKGYAAPLGQQTAPLPSTLPTAERYVALLGSALAEAKNERAGVWAHGR